MNTTVKEIAGMFFVLMAVVGIATTLNFTFKIVICPFVTWVHDYVSMFNDFRNYRKMHKRKK